MRKNDFNSIKVQLKLETIAHLVALLVISIP